MNTRLKPVENPGFLMKLGYWFSTVKFGKVITPLKVVYSRLPLGFSLFSNKISSLENKMSLDKELIYLIRHHVAQLNVCTFCMDIGVAIAIEGKYKEEKFHVVQEYKTHPFFNEQERAALDFAHELTLQKKISEPTFKAATTYFTERAVAEIAWIIATEHYYNMVNLAFNIESDQLCQLKK